MTEGVPSRLLITGAAGNMGRLLRPLLRRDGRTLRLLDRVPVTDACPGEEVVTADVTDPDALSSACQGVDAILHLAGISVEGRFDDILAVNVVGTHNLLRAAIDTGIGRVVLASSNHAAGFYRRADIPPGAEGLPDDLAPRPDTYYGWSKAAIESLASLFHDRYGLDVTLLRIGSCFARPPDARALGTWLSPADAARLVEAALAERPAGCRVVWAVSGNTRRWWSLANAEALGYRPADDAERFAADHPDLDEPAPETVGGLFCTVPLGEPMG